ncbi:hypothetical protein JKP88DRAFT_255765 [Tribonema minus]|uniref:Uncharacterized protein n=1 Tax=Tribonema minus TaxID=303371 RepID=A0A836CEK8_9STRA|nr:hypothetical protein JKP88DRAFT_255765 [Tribonema minus]
MEQRIVKLQPGVVACDVDWAAPVYKRQQPCRYMVLRTDKPGGGASEEEFPKSSVADAAVVTCIAQTTDADIAWRYTTCVHLNALIDLAEARAHSDATICARQAAEELGVPVVLACRPLDIIALRMGEAIAASTSNPVVMLKACLGHALASSAQVWGDPIELPEQHATDHDKYYEALAKTNPQLYKAFVTEHAAYTVEGLLHYMQTTGTKRGCLLVGMRHKRAVDQYLKEKHEAQEVVLSADDVAALVQD